MDPEIGAVPEIGGPIYISGTTKARTVVEKSLDRPWQDEFKPVSFVQISGAVPKFRGWVGNFQLWNY